MKEYFKLLPIKDILATTPRGYVFARDLDSSRNAKSFFYTTSLQDAYEFIYKQTPLDKRQFYEVIQPNLPVKLYLDIEIEVENTPECIASNEHMLDQQLDDLIDRLKKKHNTEWTYQLFTANGLCSDKKHFKLSRHVVFDPATSGVFTCNHKAMKQFMKNDPLPCDKGVYTNWRLFRMLGNVKRGSTRVLVPQSQPSTTEPTFDEWKRSLVTYYDDDGIDEKHLAILDRVLCENSENTLLLLPPEPTKRKRKQDQKADSDEYEYEKGTSKKRVCTTTTTTTKNIAIGTTEWSGFSGLLDWVHEEVLEKLLYDPKILKRFFVRKKVLTNTYKGKESISIFYERREETKHGESVRCPLISEKSEGGHTSNGFVVNVYLISRTLTYHCFGTYGHPPGVSQCRIKALVPKDIYTSPSNTEKDYSQPGFVFKYRETYRKICDCTHQPIWVEQKVDAATKFIVTTRCLLCDTIVIHKKK